MHTQKGLPTFSFISCEAIFWALDTFDAIKTEADAVELFKAILNAKLICHCSGERSHPFICGLYLYFVVDANNFPKEVDLEMFRKDWLEIEMSLKEVDENTRLTPFQPPYTQSEFTSGRQLAQRPAINATPCSHDSRRVERSPIISHDLSSCLMMFDDI